MNSDTSQNRADSALIIGAGSAIAKALINELLQHSRVQQIVAISREPHATDNRVTTLVCDYSAPAIKQIAGELGNYAGIFTHVFICTGILHGKNIQPEKRVEDFTESQMAEVFRINSILPALWLQALLPVLKNSARCVVSVFSARVGSISDNHKGGWYSYRASKAALNMLIKTTAIEYARRAPGVKLLAFHPGTVDTELSRPFQKNVPPEKLFTAAFVASRLLTITDTLTPDGQASYLDWAGQRIEW